VTRAAPVLVGLWLGGLLASWVSASLAFRTVDRVLGPGRRPELNEKLSSVAEPDRRLLLRHLASEINRWMFERWWIAQAVLAVLLAAGVWRSRGPERWLVLAALALVLAQGALAPMIVSLGRAIDFVPRPLPELTARRFGLLHMAYVASDLLKAGLLAALAWLLVRRA